MEHDHTYNTNIISLTNAFKIGIIVNLVFTITEALIGFLSNSMALVADAGHNLSDILALSLSWLAVRISARKPTIKYTYGFRRSTILAAILNTLLLLIAVVFILFETINRLRTPLQINAQNIIYVASLGIAVNSFTAWLFLKNRKYDLNIRSAFLHFVADALVSGGVVLSGVIMLLTGIHWIDSITSMIIIAVILFSLYKLLIDSLNLALDAVPENINIEEVRQYLTDLPEVGSVHDLHIWALSTTDAALTVHLATIIQTDLGFITKIQQQLHDRFRIGHSTIQVEFGDPLDCMVTH